MQKLQSKPQTCRTCGKHGHIARDCPCFKCGKSGHWTKNCPLIVKIMPELHGDINEKKKITLSPFNISEIHQVHSQGWTLSRTPLHRILRHLRPSHLAAEEINCGCHDRDPIPVSLLKSLLNRYVESKKSAEEPHLNSSHSTVLGEKKKIKAVEDQFIFMQHSKLANDAERRGEEKDVDEILGQWLFEIVNDPLAQLQAPGMPNICVPFLVGDCFNHRLGRFCQAGRHLSLQGDPTAHHLVSGMLEGEAGMLVRLVSFDEISEQGESPGRVKGAPIFGHENGQLITGEETNLWQKACVYPTGCRRRACRYAHACDYA